MNPAAPVSLRWFLLRATAKTAWGRLTADCWLQMEGRREARAGLLEESTSFARNRSLHRPPDWELPGEP